MPLPYSSSRLLSLVSDHNRVTSGQDPFRIIEENQKMLYCKINQFSLEKEVEIYLFYLYQTINVTVHFTRT